MARSIEVDEVGGRAQDEWSGLAFRAIIAIIFGIAAIFWPDLTLKTLVYLFGGFILATGLISLVGGLVNIYNEWNSFVARLITILLGVIEVGVGVYLLRHPRVSFATLILLIGFILIIRGVIDLVIGLFEARGAMHKTVMIVGGLIAGIAGVIILFQPVAGGVAFVWVLGLYALITGSLSLALALDLKNAESLSG